MTARAYIPATGLHDMGLGHLSEALGDFCNAEGLPHICALDLLAEVTAPHQIAWLRAFIAAWDAEDMWMATA